MKSDGESKGRVIYQFLDGSGWSYLLRCVVEPALD